MFLELEPMVSPVGPVSLVLDLGAGVPGALLTGAFLVQGGGFYWLRQLASLRTKIVAPLVMKASGDLQQMQWLLTSSLLSGGSCGDALIQAAGVHSQVQTVRVGGGLQWPQGLLRPTADGLLRCCGLHRVLHRGRGITLPLCPFFSSVSSCLCCAHHPLALAGMKQLLRQHLERLGKEEAHSALVSCLPGPWNPPVKGTLWVLSCAILGCRMMQVRGKLSSYLFFVVLLLFMYFSFTVLLYLHDWSPEFSWGCFCLQIVVQLLFSCGEIRVSFPTLPSH